MRHKLVRNLGDVPVTRSLGHDAFQFHDAADVKFRAEKSLNLYALVGELGIAELALMVNRDLHPCAGVTRLPCAEGDLCLIGVLHGGKSAGGEAICS